MRLVDVVLRQGHLSERSLVEAVVSGDRPAHLDRCDICAERALELSRWLTTVRDAAVEAADQAFPPERLAAQQSQIMRRLGLVDEPSRVIAFPGQAASAPAARRRVAPAWVGLAAAAGLVIGVIAGQATARLNVAQAPPAASTARPPAAATSQPASDTSANAGSNVIALLGTDEEFTPTVLQSIDAATPTLVARTR